MAETIYKVADDFKAAVKLFSGRTVIVDINKITAKEWREALKTGTPQDKEFEILSKATGLNANELENMSQPEYRILIDTFLKIGTQPLTNPT